MHASRQLGKQGSRQLGKQASTKKAFSRSHALEGLVKSQGNLELYNFPSLDFFHMLLQAGLVLIKMEWASSEWEEEVQVLKLPHFYLGQYQTL